MAQSTLVQASAVAIDGKALLIEGEPGSGKSSLALALIECGAQLIGDDGVELIREDERIIAAPPPNTAGKLEIRGIGIVDMPATTAQLSLILTLEETAERFRETADVREVLGVSIPTIPFVPGSIAPAERALWALRTYG